MLDCIESILIRLLIFIYIIIFFIKLFISDLDHQNLMLIIIFLILEWIDFSQYQD